MPGSPGYLMAPPVYGTNPDGSVSMVSPAKYVTADEDSVLAAKRFLMAEAAILGIAAGVPTLLAVSTRKRKGKALTEQERVAIEVAEGTANRTTSLAAALIPAFGLPISYITIQMLEDAGYIKKGLGNTVQTILAAGTVVPAVTGLIGSVLGAFAKKGK